MEVQLGFFKKMLSPSRVKRILFFLISDLIIIAVSFYSSFLLRFEFSFPQEYFYQFYYWAIGIIIIKILFLKLCGLYDINWRFVGVTELKNILICLTLYTPLLLVINMILRSYLPEFDIPSSVILIDAVFSFGFIAFWRVSKKLYFDLFLPNNKAKITLMIGINFASERILREIKSSLQYDFYPVAILDNNQERIGTKIDGVPVVGDIGKLEMVIQKNKKIETVLISLPTVSRHEMQNIFKSLKKQGINDIKIIPRVNEYQSNIYSAHQLKDLDISDLLFRDMVRIDHADIKKDLKAKVVMVTGAAGSIGSEIVRKLIFFGVEKIITYDIDESGTYNLKYDIDKIKKEHQKIEYIIGDVRDIDKLERVFEQYEPNFVFHVSAYKHVPLMNEFPEEAVKTNIFGTLNMVRISAKFKVEKFVNISTDKAVNPTSIMGATKRVAEMICSFKNTDKVTKFVSVRFGNVLGSRGSVIPLFLKQIEDGGPITVTQPDMKRYFMSIPEAVLLVFQAAHMGVGGEVFVLDMGEPVKIVDLAERLIELNNLIPHKDIDIVFTGIRPGEKLFEELLTAEEGTDMTAHEKIFVARNGIGLSFKDLSKKLKKLKNNINNREELVSILKDLIPFYTTDVESI